MRQGSIWMAGGIRERIGESLLITATLLFFSLILPGCDLFPSQDEVAEGKLLISVTSFPEANGHKLYIELRSENDVNLLAKNSDLGATFTGGEAGLQHLYGVSSSATDYILRSDTRYQLHLWVDMNDNHSTVAEPEQNVDKVTSYNGGVTGVEGDQSLGFTGSDFGTAFTAW